MAKLKFGILGPISGKLGPVIGGTWKGISYIREASEKRNLPRTPAQLANEAKFKYVNDSLVPFHPFLSIGFQNLAIQKTAIAAALSANYNTAFIVSGADIDIVYDKLIISSGPLAPLGNPHAAFSSADTVELTWAQNYQPGVVYNDQVMLVLYSEQLKYADGFVGAVNRAAEQYSFKINAKLLGQVLHAYISVTSLDRKQIANSIYLGKINPL